MVRVHPDPPISEEREKKEERKSASSNFSLLLLYLFSDVSGAIAQLGERELCKLEVAGSIPAGSTNPCAPPGGREARQHARPSLFESRMRPRVLSVLCATGSFFKNSDTKAKAGTSRAGLGSFRWPCVRALTHTGLSWWGVWAHGPPLHRFKPAP